MSLELYSFNIIGWCFLIGASIVNCDISFTKTSYYLESSRSPKNSRFNTSATGKFLFNEVLGVLNSFSGGNYYDSNDPTDHNVPNEGTVKNCSCECGITNQENRIVGGRPTGVNQYPWIARIVYDGLFHCGGSLITRDFILTAAHCVRRLKRKKIRIILGDHDQTITTDTIAKMRAVAAVIQNRNFDADSYNHDIALLKLRKSVDFSTTIRPVCLPKDLDHSGKVGTVIGWGRTMEGGMLPKVVQEVQVPILTLSQCRAMKYRASRITGYMLCAGRAQMDSCQGDSGGPLVVPSDNKFELVGIVSWGVGCARPGYPGVYTRVSKYTNWIRTNIQESCLCT